MHMSILPIRKHRKVKDIFFTSMVSQFEVHTSTVRFKLAAQNNIHYTEISVKYQVVSKVLSVFMSLL